MLWEVGIYRKEEYIQLKEREFEYYKVRGPFDDSPVIPEEIAITKKHLDPNNEKYVDFYTDGVLSLRQLQNRFDYDVKDKWKAHLKDERVALVRMVIKSNIIRKEILNGYFPPDINGTSFPRKRKKRSMEGVVPS
jgi:hypothetical protein